MKGKIEYIKEHTLHCTNIRNTMKRHVIYCSQCGEEVATCYLDEEGWVDLHYYSRLIEVEDEVPYQWRGAMAVNTSIDDCLRIECTCGNDTRKHYHRNAFLLKEVSEDYIYE